MRLGVKGPWWLQDAVICTMVVAGCRSTVSPKAEVGTLTVTIIAPSGATPNVVVVGANGYSISLSATTTLGGLAVGAYVITAPPVMSNDPIVWTIDSAVTDSMVVSVTANATATAKISYAPRPGTGGLWIANSGRAQSVAKYAAANLTSSGGGLPVASVATGDPNPSGIAFDATGNLWVALSHGNLIAKYGVAQLAGVGANTATATLTLSANAGSLNQPTGIVLGPGGSLWVTNTAANTVVGYSARQLASGGAQLPAVTIGAVAGSLNAPRALVFDGNGNLWVANANANTVVEFTAAQLVGSGNPVPAVTLSATAGSIAGPTSLAFDPVEDLWVANGAAGHNTLVQFSPSQLSSSGAPTPAVVIGATAGSLVSPTGLAFDNSNDLWVSNGNNTVVSFSAGQLQSSGSPAPAVAFATTSLMNAPIGGIAFDPEIRFEGNWDY